MWDWESSSVPYRPIQRRRLLRRRVVTLLAVAALAIPYLLYTQHKNAQPLGERVFDEVVSTVSLRYYDASYHGVPWRALTQRYRAHVVNAPTVAARYRALRAMLAALHDSHTAVYSPDDLRPLGEVKTPRDTRASARVLQAASLGPDIDWKTIAPGVGYVRIASFPDSIDSVLGWALTDLGRDRALVLDLRGNPGGLVDSVDAVAGAFLPEGSLISTGTRRYHFFGSQRFTARDAIGVRYSGRLVVLVDHDSRSGAESLARALQYYHRATIVGKRTAGKVLGVDVEITLDDGGLLRVATLDMRAPDGQRLEGRGVTPDLLVADPRDQVGAALRLVADQSPPVNPSPEPSEKSLGVIKACPVSIRDFSISAVGSTNHFVEYRIGVRTSSAVPFEASFISSGDDESARYAVEAAGIDAKTDAVLFDWPGRSFKRVGVAAVGANGVQMQCDPTTVTELTSRAPLVSGEGAPWEPGEFEMPKSLAAEMAPLDDAARTYVPTFDDSKVTAANSVGHALRDARMLRHIQPEYPDLAKESGMQGDVLVAFVVGQNGHVMSTNVVDSSAGVLLGAAARDAAQRTPFSEPRLDGEPAARTYLIEYSFRLGSQTGMRFAGI